MIGVALVTAVAAVATGAKNPAEAFSDVGTIALMGAGFFAYGALPLQRWARLRKEQMDQLAERLLSSSTARP